MMLGWGHYFESVHRLLVHYHSLLNSFYLNLYLRVINEELLTNFSFFL